MDFTNFILLTAKWLPAIWFAMFGACVGSLTNVLVYRLPLGLSVVSPPSSCPCCNTRLTWRENIPIFGWLLLRGRCRFCKSKISPEYPIVETIVALMWGGLYALWFITPDYGTGPWGMPWQTLKPDWATAGITQVWPIFLVYLSLLSCLVSMTLIDARTFTIPLVLPWFAAIFGVLGHVGWAVYVQLTSGQLESLRNTPFMWSIPVPPLPGDGGWWWIGASIGATLGLGVGLVMLRLGWIRQSFADYPQWEDAQLAQAQLSHPPTVEATASNANSATTNSTTTTSATAPTGQPPAADNPSDQAPSSPELWITYPHARREMIKEMAFLAPAAVLGWLGGTLATNWFGPIAAVVADGRISQDMSGPVPPLWLMVLAGVLMGYLIGGATVWAVRIGGSLAFGKEAMGLGDVHLMAAVGACLGWIDPVLAFFLAAFVGVGFVIIDRLKPSSADAAHSRAMPFGPSLAIATALVIVCKPLIEIGLGKLMHAEGPLNLP